MSLSHLMLRDPDVLASLLLGRRCPVAGGWLAARPVKLGDLRYLPVPESLYRRR